MPRRPAKVTQADVARTIRAAIAAGAAGVEIKPDGTIYVRLSPAISDDAPPVDDKRVIAL
jgi:hypothetical protein